MMKWKTIMSWSIGTVYSRPWFWRKVQQRNYSYSIERSHFPNETHTFYWRLPMLPTTQFKSMESTYDRSLFVFKKRKKTRKKEKGRGTQTAEVYAHTSSEETSKFFFFFLFSIWRFDERPKLMARLSFLFSSIFQLLRVNFRALSICALFSLTFLNAQYLYWTMTSMNERMEMM